jgi:type I restriction enzyme S subunit
VNKDALEAYPINLPSLEVQMGIVAKLDKIEAESKKLESHYRAKLADLDDLRQALLQKAFAGQLC